jgi:hypothetical protein
MEETSAWLTSIMTYIGIAILGIALAYGVLMWSRRSGNRAVKQVKDRATERVYDETDREEKRLQREEGRRG